MRPGRVCSFKGFRGVRKYFSPAVSFAMLPGRVWDFPRMEILRETEWNFFLSFTYCHVTCLVIRKLKQMKLENCWWIFFATINKLALFTRVRRRGLSLYQCPIQFFSICQIYENKPFSYVNSLTFRPRVELGSSCSLLQVGLSLRPSWGARREEIWILRGRGGGDKEGVFVSLWSLAICYLVINFLTSSTGHVVSMADEYSS